MRRRGNVQQVEYNWRNPGFAQTDEHPVVNVSWNDAVAFCNPLSAMQGLKPYYLLDSGTAGPWAAIGYRLPDRGRVGVRLPGRDDDALRERRRPGDARGGREHRRRHRQGHGIPSGTGRSPRATATSTRRPRAASSPTPSACSTCTGNVAEWCWDWYEERYPNQPTATDPRGPAEGKVRVNRGGDWHDGPPRPVPPTGMGRCRTTGSITRASASHVESRLRDEPEASLTITESGHQRSPHWQTFRSLPDRQTIGARRDGSVYLADDTQLGAAWR